MLTVVSLATPVVRRTHTGLPSTLRLSVMRLARRLRAEREDDSLTLNQLATLGTLNRHGPMTLGALAAHERVQPPSMTRIVSGLEERGLAVRQPDASDRRLVVVRITAEGAALLAADRRRRDAWLARRLRELTADEHEALRRAAPVLEKLARL
jgi:DNA-binding MarR family transcriptional regulator